MAHYMIAQLNGGRYGERQILSEAGIEEMQRGAAEIKEMGMLMGSYGMGWIDQEAGRSRIVSHSGIVPDFGAFMALVPEQKKGYVLLFNVNHAMTKMTFDEMGIGAARLLAGEALGRHYLGFAPWAMRGMLLIPILQITGIIATMALLRRWRETPDARPSGGRLWRQHILLPLIPNLLAALTLAPLLGKMRGFFRLFAPDYVWIAMICGSLAGVWAVLRSVLIIRANRRSP
jgi:CubicO group peptidase (beta-lactamase class C family)